MTIIYTKTASFSGHQADDTRSVSPITPTTGIVVPNDCMEAGVSLRKSPIPANLETFETLPSALTGDFEHFDNHIQRHPSVDRAFLHSQRRSQLIFDQKLSQRRLPLLSEQHSTKSRRPQSVSYQSASAPFISENTASAYLDVAASTQTSPATARLRALNTGPAAQPASRRASWIRYSTALSDSTHGTNASSLLSPPRTPETAISRPHSAVSMIHDNVNRHSVMSNGSSSSSPAKEGGSAESVEVVRSNGMSVVKQENEPSNDTDMHRQDSGGVPDMFTTPRSSSELEKAKETQFGSNHRPNGHTDSSPVESAIEEEKKRQQQQQPTTATTEHVSVVPATPPALPTQTTTMVSPINSPTSMSRALLPERSPRRPQSELPTGDRSTPTGQGSLAVPRRRSSVSGNTANARRGSTTSVLSASSSTASAHRIRRKAVPSEDGDGEMREYMASEGRPSMTSSMQGRRGSHPGHSSLDINNDDSFGPPAAQLAARRPSAPEFNVNSTPPGGESSTDGAQKTLKPSLSFRNLDGDSSSSAIPRLASRNTIKRPTTDSNQAAQSRAVSAATRAPVLEVEGLQFLLGKDDEVKEKSTTKATLPNSVRFLQQDFPEDAAARREAAKSPHRKSMVNHSRNTSSETRSPKSAANTWDLQKELEIVERVRLPSNNSTTAGRSVSMDTPRAANDSGLTKPSMLSLIDEDENEQVRAAAREANIPEGSYAIHPPSMLQLFEASQCVVYDEDGGEVMLGDLFKKKRTLVCFLRHWWCGFCQQFAMSVRHIDPLPLKRANMDFIIIGQGDYSVIKAYREVMQVQYPMYADPKRNVYRALGMTVRTNDANPACARPDYAAMGMTKGILVAIKKGLFDMPIRSPGDMKLLGGDFILGPGLQCSFTHRMTTADGHMDIPRILAQAGCDMSLKTPKQLISVDEKEERQATLAGGNRHQGRSLGLGRSKSMAKLDVVPDTKKTAADTSVADTGKRSGVFGRLSNKFSRSQVSLSNNNGSTADVSHDHRSWRGASASRKKSIDSRVRGSFESRQTEIEFESRATSIDTRAGGSEFRSPIHKTKSLAELRKSFTDTFRSKGRNASSSSAAATRISMDSKKHPVPPLPPPKDIQLLTPITSSMRSGLGSVPPSPRTLQPGQMGEFGGTPKGTQSMSRASSKGAISMSRDTSMSRGMSNGTAGHSLATGPSGRARTGSADETAASTGNFLTDLDVYEPLSRRSAQRGDDASLQRTLSKSETGHQLEAADADSDTEPALADDASAPRRSATQTNGDANTNGEPATSTSMSTFQSFSSARGKSTNLTHLPEADEDADGAGNDSFEQNDEPVEFDTVVRHV